MDNIKYIDVKEFAEQGFLQEANRLFFHPLGLALSVEIDWPDNVTDEEKKKYGKPIEHPNAKWSMGDVWDYRDDPEGMLFGEGMSRKEKAEKVEALRKSKLAVRTKLKDCDENGIQSV